MKKPGATHKALAKIAKEMAGEFYENAAHDNDFYRHFPNPGVFIGREWWRFLGFAEQSLWKIVNGETDWKLRAEGKSEDLINGIKEDCLEIIFLNKTLPKDGKAIAAAHQR